MSILRKELVARPLSEWSEEDGNVLWWRFPIEEPPYVGSPLDAGYTVEVHAHAGVVASGHVGGWPGYHTHWTPLVFPLTCSDMTLSALPVGGKVMT